MNTLKNDLTVGNPGRVLWRFSIPLFVSAVFQQMYSMADSIIAGKFAGEDALAAVGASYSITMIFMAVAFGCNIGCSVIISRLYGAKKTKEMKTAVSTSLIACLVLAALLTAGGLLFNDYIMRLIKTPQNIFADSALYLRVYICGFVFLFLYNICTGIFTAMGDSKTPLYFLIGSSIGNIGLDLLFVIRFGLGVAGVAWATFIAQGIACLLSLVVLLMRLKKIHAESYHPFSLKTLGQISKIAIPSVLQQSFISLSSIFIQSLINAYGSSVIAGYSAAFKMNVFATTCFATLSNGMSSFASQNIGARRFDRVRKGYKDGVIMVVGLATVLTILYCMLPRVLLGLFLDENTGGALQTGMEFLWIVAPAYCFVAVKIMTDGVLRGGGAMTQFMIATFLDMILRVVLAFILNVFLGARGIWASWPIGWIISSIVSVIFYRTEHWKLHKL